MPPETGRSALLVLDVMPVIVPAFGGDDSLLGRLAAACREARQAKVPVVLIRAAFRDGYPEVSPSNKVFSAAIAHFDFQESGPGVGIHPGVGQEPEDIVIVKRRVSAFAGTDLDLVLRSQGIEHVVLAGVTTSGVVLSTVRQAADLDYRITVLSDGCADGDQTVHDLLMERVFAAHADVVTVAEWTDSLR